MPTANDWCRCRGWKSRRISRDRSTDHSGFRYGLRAAIAHADRTLELGVVSVALDAGRDGDGLLFELRDFRAGELILGRRAHRRDGTGDPLRAAGAGARPAACRCCRAGLAGDLDAVRERLDGLQRGTLRDLTLNSEAHDLALLADPSALRATARPEAATVAVPAAGIVVENGSGRFLMADGVLQGSELAGKIGRSSPPIPRSP